MEATQEEKDLYEALRILPDWDCFPVPQSWFKKFDIPPRNPVSVREYLASNYAMKMAVAPKDLPPLNIRVPQQNGKLVEFQVVEEPIAEVVSRPFEIVDGEFPDVLSSLREPEPVARSRRRVHSQSGRDLAETLRIAEQKDETQVQ